MAIKYRVQKKRNGINDKENYYAVPISSGLISTREIAQRLSERSTLSSADIRATLIALAEIMESLLHDGYSIKLEDIGIFSLSVTSQGYDSPKECTPHHVKAKKICFRADTKLKRNLKKVKFERDKLVKVL